MRIIFFAKQHWQIFAIVAAIFAVWHMPVVYPLKLLVVFLHETSHGLAAILTGGRVEEMALSPQQGGHAVTVGGNLFAILSAGYLGSLAFGIAIFLGAVRTSFDRAVMGLLGLLVIAVTLLFMVGWFPLLFGLATGGAMLAMARWLPHVANDFALRIIGLTNMIYVPYDIFSDTLARSELQSDARILAERIGGATVIWGGLWLLISLVAIALCFRYGLLGPSNIALRWRRP